MSEVAVATAAIEAAARSAQDNWRWCTKCQGLAFSGNPTPGACPAGGTHYHAESGNYSIIHDTPILPHFSQDIWRWCTNGLGLAFAGNPAPGACPAGRTHDHAGSGNYSLMQNTPVSIPLTQDNWRWCTKCQGLASQVPHSRSLPSWWNTRSCWKRKLRRDKRDYSAAWCIHT
jgi:hypothetical protein